MALALFYQIAFSRSRDGSSVATEGLGKDERGGERLLRSLSICAQSRDKIERIVENGREAFEIDELPFLALPLCADE